MSNTSDGCQSIFHEKHELDDDDQNEDTSKVPYLGVIPCKWCLVGFIISTLIMGIVLSVFAVMYTQDKYNKKMTITTETTTTSTTSTTSTTTSTTSTTSTTTTSTSTSTTTSTTSTTSSALPAQCFSYYIDTDGTRNVGYSSISYCDTGLYGSGTWVRFMSPAGTQLITYAPSYYSCGTTAPGWYNGAYPSSAGSTTTGTLCYYWSGATCFWTNAVSITHCQTFYVFYLVDPPGCDLRYCTA